MTRIIEFKSKQDKREEALDEVSKEVDQYIDDIVMLIKEKDYGEVLENKISGIVLIVDFENKETTTQVWIDDSKIQ